MLDKRLSLSFTESVRFSPSADSPGWVNIFTNVLVRFLSLNAGFIKWIMALEVFPTSARSFGFACVLTCSRMGAMAAPFLRDLGEATAAYVPYVIQALFLLASGCISLLLPETLNKPLPDTFHEAESLDRKKIPKTSKPLMEYKLTRVTT